MLSMAETCSRRIHAKQSMQKPAGLASLNAHWDLRLPFLVMSRFLPTFCTEGEPKSCLLLGPRMAERAHRHVNVHMCTCAHIFLVQKIRLTRDSGAQCSGLASDDPLLCSARTSKTAR